MKKRPALAENGVSGESDRPVRRYRSIFTFGTGEGSPSEAVLAEFDQVSLFLSTTVPIPISDELLKLAAATDPSDRIMLIEGVVVHVAAAIWAFRQILSGEVAILAGTHHVRAVFEAHAMCNWMFGDYESRSLRLLRSTLRSRKEFEDSFRKVRFELPSNLQSAALELIEDTSVKKPPTVFDQCKGNPLLEFDYPLLWKFASAHVHAFNIRRSQVDSVNERLMIEQLLSGIIRHGSAVYRSIVEHFKLTLAVEPSKQLQSAEQWSQYPQDSATP